ncbi:class I SAM-dependent methyltransferase [Hyalangium versicolor]|uniref:class I SAM-dependent methyltransferase n=1 Tax=Hyalangium versicolor TaxID=2861190 RepID=UPI001CCAD7EE|nr:methyltransferase domain-containing protein [Hyalangium versicolor]
MADDPSAAVPTQDPSPFTHLAACSRMPGWKHHFGKPEGFVGAIIGHCMAFLNRQRSLRVLALVAPSPEERILEIGFGPGADIRRVSRVAAFVAGVDQSRTMLQQARRRNAGALRAGRVELQLGDAGSLPFAEASFDKAYSINSAQFWPDRLAALREIHRVLKPGGRVIIAVQPRSAGANERTSQVTAAELTALLAAGGFQNVRTQLEPTRPVPTACAIAAKP